MLTFEYPFAFLIIAVIPLFYVLRHIGIFSRISFPLTLSDWHGRAFSWKHPVTGIAVVAARFLFSFGFLFGVIALTGPAITRQEKVFTSRGADIIFVVDTSPSMAALDIGSSTRLAAAKTVIAQLKKNLQGTSFGLVAMASEAALIVPPTQNDAFFLNRLESLRIGELGDGTAIGTGLGTAIYHLSHSKAPKKSIVLLTDGENNSGTVHPITAARLAYENGIVVYTVALGTKGAVPVEYTDPATGKNYSGYLDSGFDDSMLHDIARIAGGSCSSAENLSSLKESLDLIAKQETVVQTYQVKNKTRRYHVEITGLAVIFVFLAWCIRRLYLKEIV